MFELAFETENETKSRTIVYRTAAYHRTHYKGPCALQALQHYKHYKTNRNLEIFGAFVASRASAGFVDDVAYDISSGSISRYA